MGMSRIPPGSWLFVEPVLIAIALIAAVVALCAECQ